MLNITTHTYKDSTSLYDWPSCAYENDWRNTNFITCRTSQNLVLCFLWNLSRLQITEKCSVNKVLKNNLNYCVGAVRVSYNKYSKDHLVWRIIYLAVQLYTLSDCSLPTFSYPINYRSTPRKKLDRRDMKF